MGAPLVLMIVLITIISLSSLLRGEDITDVAESSSRRTFARKSLRFPLSNKIPVYNEQQFWDIPLPTMDLNMDSLMRSNLNLMHTIRRLEMKFDRILGAIDCEDDALRGQTRKFVQHMRDPGIQVMNEAPHNDFMKQLVDAVEHSNKIIEKLATNFEMVMDSSKRSMQSLANVADTVQVINERTLQIQSSSRFPTTDTFSAHSRFNGQSTDVGSINFPFNSNHRTEIKDGEPLPNQEQSGDKINDWIWNHGQDNVGAQKNSNEMVGPNHATNINPYNEGSVNGANNWNQNTLSSFDKKVFGNSARSGVGSDTNTAQIPAKTLEGFDAVTSNGRSSTTTQNFSSKNRSSTGTVNGKLENDTAIGHNRNAIKQNTTALPSTTNEAARNTFKTEKSITISTKITNDSVTNTNSPSNPVVGSTSGNLESSKKSNHRGNRIESGKESNDKNVLSSTIVSRGSTQSGVQNGTGVNATTRISTSTATTVTSGGNTKRTYRNIRKNMQRVTHEPNKQNCHQLTARRNGIYKFGSLDETANDGDRFFLERYCDFDTDGHAWTVIQRRFADFSMESFNRTWLDYKLGFGDLDDEFWFGNDFISRLTNDADVELRIILQNKDGNGNWMEYSLFKMKSENENYKLVIGDFKNGTDKDSLIYHNGEDFSTFDHRSGTNLPCASTIGNGWWFKNCNEGVLGNWLGSTSTKMMIRTKK